LVKVLYILGSSRCGSTVLANILGELSGFFSGGEIRYLWERVLQDRRCGCQLPVAQCDIWASVLSAGRVDAKCLEAISLSQRQLFRVHRTPRLLRQSPEQLLQSKPLARYLAAITDVYERLGSLTAAGVIVDSSKRPSNGAVLRLIPGVDPYFLHLVRDPRAVAYSNLRSKSNPDREGGAEMPRMTARFTAIHWLATNLAAEDLRRHLSRDRSLFLRYEDFVARPKPAVHRILEFLGENSAADPFTDSRTVVLGANHTVSGNSDRFKTGRVHLRQDADWVRRLSSRDHAITTALTLPLLSRYGYHLRRPIDGAVPAAGEGTPWR